MTNSLMPVVAQLPAWRWKTQEPVLILGFDATDALCITADGNLTYVGHGELTVDWKFDQDAGVWTSTASTMEDLLVEEPEGDTGRETEASETAETGTTGSEPV